MERGNFIVIAIVVAAVALFAMRFFSESPEEAQLAALSAGDRAGHPGGGGSALGEYGEGSDGRGGGRLGGSGGTGAGGGRLGSHGADQGGRGPNGRSGSASTVVGGGGQRAGGSVGASGSTGPGGHAASGATVADIGGVARVAPKAERQANLVESLGSRPPTKSDLEKPVPADNGDDVALKVNTTKDITDQDGSATGKVQDAQDGDQGVKIEPNSRVEFPNAASKEGSISFTIKPDWSGADPTDNALVQIRQEHEWNNRLEIVKNGEFLRFILTDNTGKEADISTRITDWQPGEEKAVEFSWGNGRTEATVDNQVVGRNEYPGELQFDPNTPMIFGADHPGSTYGSAQATIGNFTVGKSPLFTQ
jgi:hypothetical protein